MARMVVNGEAVYVPEMKHELIKGLERMGVFKIAGEPLHQANMQELNNEYRHVLQACVLRRQRKQHAADKKQGAAHKATAQRPRRPVQMVLVPAR